MKLKIPAILITVLLLAAAIYLIIHQGDSKVPAGDESWAEISVCPIGAVEKSQVPDSFDECMLILKDVLRSDSIKDRVSEIFQEVLPRANCSLQIDSIRLERVTGTNRIVLRMKTSNPLIGSAILQEVLVRAEGEFHERTGLPDHGSTDLERLKLKQKEFQRRIGGVQSELDQLLRGGASDSTKVQSLRSQLENFMQMDEMMTQQLESLEALGADMTFVDPTLELNVEQAPTFDRVGHYQLQKYDSIQRENPGLLSPLTPAMQNAFQQGTGFTVE